MTDPRPVTAAASYWRFREARVDEAHRLSNLVNSAYRGEISRKGWTTEADLLDGQRTDPEAVLDLLTGPNSIVLIAENPLGEPDGCVLLERVPGGVLIGMLTVRPDRQRNGLGREMIKRAERYARDQWEAQYAEMTVIRHRQELIAWYGRRGYAPTGATKPFPLGNPRFGIPKVTELEFVVLKKKLD